jgi:hypothetical protein
MRPPNEEFFTLFSEAGSNIVEYAPQSSVPLHSAHQGRASEKAL